MKSPKTESLEERVARLEADLARITATCNGLQERARPRRRMIQRSAVLLGVLFSGVAVAAIFSTSGARLQQYIQYNTAVAFPPLDSLAIWGRTDAAGGGTPGYTTELLSLVAEGAQANSYQWPLYVELRGTTHPKATQASSQSVGATVRSVVRSPGSPWTVGFHSEVAHGRTEWNAGNPTVGKAVATDGTSILFNGEIRSSATTGKTQGLNLQCTYTDAGSRRCDNAINIQTGSAATYWQDAIHFDGTGSYINGKVGINFDRSRYGMGLDLADNSLRMNTGQKLMLNKNGTTYLWVNPSRGVVEIVRNGKVVGSF